MLVQIGAVARPSTVSSKSKSKRISNNNNRNLKSQSSWLTTGGGSEKDARISLFSKAAVLHNRQDYKQLKNTDEGSNLEQRYPLRGDLLVKNDKSIPVEQLSGSKSPKKRERSRTNDHN